MRRSRLVSAVCSIMALALDMLRNLIRVPLRRFVRWLDGLLVRQNDRSRSFHLKMIMQHFISAIVCNS